MMGMMHIEPSYRIGKPLWYSGRSVYPVSPTMAIDADLVEQTLASWRDPKQQYERRTKTLLCMICEHLEDGVAIPPTALIILEQMHKEAKIEGVRLINLDEFIEKNKVWYQNKITRRANARNR